MLIASEVVLRERRAVPSRFARTMLAVLLGGGLALYSLSAHALRAVEEVTQLLEQGNAKQAAKQADGYLQQNPGDVEMRFMRGLIATEQKQSEQAIKIFASLVRDHPNMPEPYNNLAVLYAAGGQERKAAEALEQAIRTNPSYTTAHENLGDLYARMASEAYSKALQLDSSRQAIAPKLALITQLVPGQQNPAKTVVAQAAPIPLMAPVSPAKTEPVQAKAPTKPETKPEVTVEKKPEPMVAVAKKPEPAPEAKPLPKVEAKSAPAAVAVAAPAAVAAVAKAEGKPAQPAVAEVAPAQPVAKPVAAVPAPPSADQLAVAEVESAVTAWATAWEKQDMSRYLAAYSSKFVPANGSSLADWKEARRVRIVGKDDISVTLQNVRVSVDGDEATAKFRQSYAAGRLKTATRKTLSMRLEKGSWRIVRESTGG